MELRSHFSSYDVKKLLEEQLRKQEELRLQEQREEQKRLQELMKIQV
jgi:hypothetical protein